MWNYAFVWCQCWKCLDVDVSILGRLLFWFSEFWSVGMVLLGFSDSGVLPFCCDVSFFFFFQFSVSLLSFCFVLEKGALLGKRELELFKIQLKDRKNQNQNKGFDTMERRSWMWSFWVCIAACHIWIFPVLDIQGPMPCLLLCTFRSALSSMIGISWTCIGSRYEEGNPGKWQQMELLI